MNYEAQADLLKALAHPARLQILDLLRGGERCVCHIERVLGQRQAYVSQQLMVLRDAGLVEARKEGLQMHYRLKVEGMPLWFESLFSEPQRAIERIEGCPCPACSVVEVTSIR